jgi:hypothetical protein
MTNLPSLPSVWSEWQSPGSMFFIYTKINTHYDVVANSYLCIPSCEVISLQYHDDKIWCGAICGQEVLL